MRLWLSNNYDTTKSSPKASIIKIDCIGQEIGHIEDIKDLVIYNEIADIKDGNGVVKILKLFNNVIAF